MDVDKFLVPRHVMDNKRINVWWLIVTVGLAFIGCVSICVLSMFVNDYRKEALRHFSHMMSVVNEGEKFLNLISEKSNHELPGVNDQAGNIYGNILSEKNGVYLYEGRALFSMPFSLTYPEKISSIGVDSGPVYFAAMLSGIYSDFWASSKNLAPQMLVIDLHGPTTLAIPAIGKKREINKLSWKEYPEHISQLRQLLVESPPKKGGLRIFWRKINTLISGKSYLVGYIDTPVPDGFWWKNKIIRHVVVLIAIELDGTDFYNELFAEGKGYLYSLNPPDLSNKLDNRHKSLGFETHVSFSFSGIDFYFKKKSGEQWEGVYSTSYLGFLNYAKWFYLFSVVFYIIFALGIIAFRCWYLKNLVDPVSKGFSGIKESFDFYEEAFFQASAAICIVRCADLEILLKNKLFKKELVNEQRFIELLDKVGGCGEVDNDISTCYCESDRFFTVGLRLTRYNSEKVYHCTFKEITDYKIIKEELAKEKKKSDIAVEAKNILLMSVSHEIRTPLYGVIGGVELLENGITEDDYSYYIGVVKKSSEVLLNSINNILDVSKFDSGEMALEPVEFSPQELLEEVMSEYSSEAINKGLQFYCCTDVDLPRNLIGDCSKIKKILINLVDNAIKFTEFGRVVVRLKVLENSIDIIRLQWQVSDTGIGIEKKQQDKLFDNFFKIVGGQQLDGVGLGLSISSRLCRLMEGDLNVVSEKGLGSSFSLSIPLQGAGSSLLVCHDVHFNSGTVVIKSSIKELELSISQWLQRWGLKVADLDSLNLVEISDVVYVHILPSSKSKKEVCQPVIWVVNDAPSTPIYVDNKWKVSINSLRGLAIALEMAFRGERVSLSLSQPDLEIRYKGNVLLLEENSITKRILEAQLSFLGCKVFSCSDAREIIQKIDKGFFDALFIGIDISDAKGYEFVKLIRQKNVAIPIVAVAANTLKYEIEKWREVGISTWLVKPITLASLRKCLLRLMDLK